MYQHFSWTTVGEARNAILRLYEPVQPYVFLELAKDLGSEVFVDVGANIGAYSVFLSSLASIQRIYSFEAALETYNELEKNVSLNNHAGKIQTFHKAISEREGKVRFGIVGSFSGANSIVSTSIHQQPKFTGEVVVDCAPLDDVVSERSKNICIKIDVEGHEKAVLAGAKSLLTENASLVQVEDYLGADSSPSEILRSYGYVKIFSIGPDGYFTNRPDKLTADVVLSAFARAATTLIRSNFEIKTATRLRMGPGVALEITGPLARFARSLKRKLSSPRSSPIETK
jgi:FkbM family methyltransferase